MHSVTDVEMTCTEVIYSFYCFWYDWF